MDLARDRDARGLESSRIDAVGKHVDASLGHAAGNRELLELAGHHDDRVRPGENPPLARPGQALELEPARPLLFLGERGIDFEEVRNSKLTGQADPGVAEERVALVDHVGRVPLEMSAGLLEER